MNYSEFKERFVLINDNKFEIGYNESEFDKPYMKVGYCDRKIYFNIIEEEENIYYAVFEDEGIETAEDEDTDIDFDFIHDCDWISYKDVLKYETKYKKLIIFGKCDKCNDIIIDKFENIAYCNDCGDCACELCSNGSYDSCYFCGADYCDSCGINYSEILQESYCDSCEDDAEEAEQEQEQAGY